MGMGLDDKEIIILDQWAVQRLGADSNSGGDLMREIFEFLALHKNRIHAVTSAQIHDVVSQVWFSNSRLFNYFADIIKRGDLPIIDGQSYADSIKDVCKYHSQTHDTIVILTPNPDIYKDVNIGVTVIPIEPEQFKKFVMDEDEDFMKHCKEFK